MNRPCAGNILLVGEGNFSLSLALRHQLPDVQMTSTALLDGEAINIHQTAQENMKLLKSKSKVFQMVWFFFFCFFFATDNALLVRVRPFGCTLSLSLASTPSL